MNKRLLIVVFTIYLSVSMGQTDTTIFNSLHNVETNEYVLSIPQRWQYVPSVDASSKDRKYDFTGVSLPEEVNHTPFIANLQVRKYECTNIKQADDYVLSEFSLYPDRITPPGFSYLRDTLTISSGQPADLFLTHYFRRTKASNYTRYDMVVYSAKRKAAYILTATFQYRDPTYAIEDSLKLKQYMWRVFRSLLLR